MDNKEMNMENDFKNDFFTKEQLQSLINIPIHDVINDLDAYIYYEGIVSEIPFDEETLEKKLDGAGIKALHIETRKDDRREPKSFVKIKPTSKEKIYETIFSLRVSGLKMDFIPG